MRALRQLVLICACFWVSAVPLIRNGTNQPGGEPTRTYLPLATNPKPIWVPEVGADWQIQFTGPVNSSLPVAVYDLDLFETEIELIDALHARGVRVLCYISVGSWEEYRPDAIRFPRAVIGKDYTGWPGEKWLDIRRIDLLDPILSVRFDLCRSKGFDGVDPDNVDGYINDTGFPLTYRDQLAFNIWISQQAHARRLSVGLKNDSEQTADLLAYFDWALSEDCFDQVWCVQFSPFIAAEKPVFAIEYTDTGISLDDICPQAQQLGFSLILKRRSLDAYRTTCPQLEARR